jgi:hypothetical protein
MYSSVRFGDAIILKHYIILKDLGFYLSYYLFLLFFYLCLLSLSVVSVDRDTHASAYLCLCFVSYDISLRQNASDCKKLNGFETM